MTGLLSNWLMIVPLLCVFWALQSVGVWVQMRNYREMMASIARNYPDGFVGAGASKGRLSQGHIVLVVVSPQRKILSVAVMAGRTVFARFRPVPQYLGLHLDEFHALMEEDANKGRKDAPHLGFRFAARTAVKMISGGDGPLVRANAPVAQTEVPAQGQWQVAAGSSA